MGEKSTAMRIFRQGDLNLFNDRQVLKFRYGDEGAWIIVSFGSDGHRERLHRSIFKHCDDLFVNGVTTFFFDAGGFGAEWEPESGPISTWVECAKGWGGKDCFGHPIGARRHWFYEWVRDEPGNWSQLAVDNEGLKEKLLAGDLDGIFWSLRVFAEHAKNAEASEGDD